jgi:hypothetical protein
LMSSAQTRTNEYIAATKCKLLYYLLPAVVC